MIDEAYAKVCVVRQAHHERRKSNDSDPAPVLPELVEG